MTSQPKQPSKPAGMRVNLPANLEPIYTNFALISNSASEIILDCAQIMPRTPQANVRARLVMTPINAKLLWRALGEHIERYEQQYGELQTPQSTTLADQLFHSPDDDPDDDPEKEE